jgi:hypothetical protein
VPDHSKTTIVARINKDGTHVVCGQKNCGIRLAEVAINQGGRRVMGKSTPRPPRQVDYVSTFDRSLGPRAAGAVSCHIVFGAGWQYTPEENLWKLTKRSQRQLAVDQKFAAGNVLTISAREKERARQRIASGRSASWAHRSAPDPSSGVTSSTHPEHGADLPTFAKCPGCGVNRLEPSLRDEAIARFRRDRDV